MYILLKLMQNIWRNINNTSQKRNTHTLKITTLTRQKRVYLGINISTAASEVVNIDIKRMLNQQVLTRQNKAASRSALITDSRYSIVHITISSTNFFLCGALFYMEYLGRRLIVTKGRFFVTRRSFAK
jgi:hypothetical protein